MLVSLLGLCVAGLSGLWYIFFGAVSLYGQVWSVSFMYPVHVLVGSLFFSGAYSL